MNLFPIKDKLVADGLVSGSGPGRNIFLHLMPEHVFVGVLLMDDSVGTPIDHELPGYYKTGFQVIVRHTEHTAGFALAEAVSNALTLANVTLGTLKVKYIRPKHQPVVFPASKGDLLEFSVNFDACFVVLS